VKRVPGWEYIAQHSEGSSTGWALTVTRRRSDEPVPRGGPVGPAGSGSVGRSCVGYEHVSVRIDSDEGGGLKSLMPAEVRLVAEALGVDVWST
jgi:hypothetical protein